MRLKRLFDGLLCLDYVFWRCDRSPFNVDTATSHSQHLAQVHGESVSELYSPSWCRGGGLPQEGGRGHLPACHAVAAIVYKNNGQTFSPVGRMHCFSSANGGNIAISLISEHYEIGPATFDSRGHGNSSAVRGLSHVNVKIIICQHGTSSRWNPHGLAANPEFVNHLSHEPVDNAVAATRTVVKDVIL